MKFYPLTFEPIFKDRIWGGSKLKSYLNKSIVSETTGESWEISTVSGDISVVNTGVLKGKNINDIIELYPEEILGKNVIARFGNQFPLLFKFIDAKEDLSIQLHPNDALAKERHNSFGKTEMWYVMQADESARLVVGFKKDSNREEYISHLENKNLVALLNESPVKKGDVFFLETGTIHAIGAGVVVAEIQQTSDVTYRIYDWDRVDANGQGRELHTELALDAINYNATHSKIEYKEEANQSTLVVDCPYFKTKIVALQDRFIWKKTKDAFTVFMCTNGQFEMVVNGEILRYNMGDTILIPAIIEHVTLKGKATLLEISI
ncbi:MULTISPECIES: type I phosphomannose isomerase catalytic subunit [unclassified Flavobacterium]|uniref:type I phosphomannose isomerase catalytic subunit n=1 Tax=unclassified Flavobacterium TaxID=196869 RepID=UPI001291AF6F|nr:MULTISPECIES: type I phosphomannose isomerase catalytic subunit [unclassified Flavobacterium]MQP51979.1 mannose-6-phosphate isomerase [Flavobacterium sp. LMO9]MQP61848.1 mannose-6-phosphate isomerase [Flavobacterium sp. LMO6]